MTISAPRKVVVILVSPEKCGEGRSPPPLVLLDWIPWVNVTSPFQWRERLLHRRQPLRRQFLGVPAVRPRHDADWARLVVQINLVTPDAENLPRNVGRRVRPQKRDQLRDVVRTSAFRASFQLLLGLAWHRLDHPAERMRTNAVRADVVTLHIHRDTARQTGDAELSGAVIHLTHTADQTGGGGDVN